MAGVLVETMAEKKVEYRAYQLVGMMDNSMAAYLVCLMVVHSADLKDNQLAG